MEQATQASKQYANARLGTAPLLPLIFSLAVPTALAQLVNLLYNIVDRIYVGHIPGTGSLALAGLGVCYPILVLVSAFSALVGMGGAPRASVAMGRGDYAGAERIMGNCVTLLVCISLTLSLGFTVFGRGILLTFGASENTLPFALEYLSIYLCGTLFVQFTMGMNAFITNQGFAKTSMATTCIGAVCNIVLDPLFIYGFGMGVRGAALATVLSQAVSACWVLCFFLGKKSVLRLRRKNLIPDKTIVVTILSLGISPFVMGATECLVQLAFNTGAKRYGTDETVAIMSILFSIAQIITLPNNGFSQGVQPVIGYNFGARQYARVRRAFLIMLSVTLSFAAAVVLAVELFPQAFLGLFTSDAAILDAGRTPLRIYMFGLSLMGAQTACQQTFLGLGEAKISVFIAFLRKVILLLPLALTLPRVFGALGLVSLTGLYLAEPISDCLSATICTTLFFAVEWRKLRKMERSGANLEPK